MESSNSDQNQKRLAALLGSEAVASFKKRPEFRDQLLRWLEENGLNCAASIDQPTDHNVAACAAALAAWTSTAPASTASTASSTGENTYLDMADTASQIVQRAGAGTRR